jgi:hypothetical protein
MELKVTTALDESGAVIPDNFQITEILDGLDALENPIKIKGESGQHTRQSIINNILTRNQQIEYIEMEIEKWQTYLEEIEKF